MNSNPNIIPQTVAIIMDGNGRWACERGKARAWGHVKGARNISKIVRQANNLGIKTLVLYAFSTENLSRPVKEVKVLFKLLRKFLMSESQEIISQNLKFKIIGDISVLDRETKELIFSLTENTNHNTGMELIFAFNYGGRQEIISACNAFMRDNPGVPFSQELFSQYLYDSQLDQVDLLIRTGGDHRISNFLLWQIAYAELFFTNTYWPEFSENEFKEIFNAFSLKSRRFGSLEQDANLKKSHQLCQLNQITI
jgi:undecaprenyl diphosphate synthase